MAKQDQLPKGAEVVSAQVPGDIAEMIVADARSADRSQSYVLREIITAHYAKRAKRVSRERSAA